MRNSRLALGILLAYLIAPWLVTRVEAEGASGLSVEDVVFCAAIKDRAPAGIADTFPSGIYSIYCYTRLAGSGAVTSITHEWYHGRARVAVMKLPVRFLPWRTWSFKQMKKDLKGDWRVDVVGPDGAVLASRKFFLK
jgi:hypothetical protein